MAGMNHENNIIPKVVSKIGIIGGGISGIAAAKQLSHHNPIIFEATDSIGGVWKHCTYNSTKLQSQRGDYQFTDFPWPDRDNPDFPTHVEVLEYIQSYAKHFDLMKNIKFNSKVVELKFIGNQECDSSKVGLPSDVDDYGTLLPGHPVWEVAVQTNDSNSIQVFIHIIQVFIDFLTLIYGESSIKMVHNKICMWLEYKYIFRYFYDVVYQN